MQTAINPFGDMFQVQFNASRRVGEAFFSNMEKMDMVLLNAMQRILVNNFNFIGGMNRTQDSGELIRQPGFPARMPQEFLSYQKEFVEIFVDTQREFAGLLQGYVEQVRSGMASPGALAAASSETPAETPAESMMRANPIGGMLSFWEYTLRELTSFAQKNMMAMQSSMENTARQGTTGTTGIFRNAAENVTEGMAFASKNAEDLTRARAKELSPTGKKR